MLRSELTGKHFNKTQERQLVRQQTGRSEGSIERKHMNISAALRDQRLAYVMGYKPLSNMQRDLRDAVEAYVDKHQDIAHLMEHSARREQSAPKPDFIRNMSFSNAPVIEFDPDARSRNFVARRIDFIAKEGANRSLGHAGEVAVVDFEKQRLIALGQSHLADRIEHISVTIGDGAGFDVLSFDEAGRERYIEVKTTRQDEQFPFYVSRNEVDFSDLESSQFSLYRLYRFDTPRQGIYQLPGSLRRSCSLDPTHFVAHPQGA